jgi:hypothetical protein
MAYGKAEACGFVAARLPRQGTKSHARVVPRAGTGLRPRAHGARCTPRGRWIDRNRSRRGLRKTVLKKWYERPVLCPGEPLPVPAAFTACAAESCENGRRLTRLPRGGNANRENNIVIERCGGRLSAGFFEVADRMALRAKQTGVHRVNSNEKLRRADRAGETRCFGTGGGEWSASSPSRHMIRIHHQASRQNNQCVGMQNRVTAGTNGRRV